jgi:hypothetical protein
LNSNVEEIWSGAPRDTFVDWHCEAILKRFPIS